MSDITVVGNIGSEPELRFSQSGTAILSFSLAEGHRKKVNGEWEDAGTTWRRVTVWEQKAELYGEHLSKGHRVIVQGTEELKTFQTKEGGEGKSLELSARNIGVIPKAPKGGQSQVQRQQSQADPWGAGDDTPPF